MSRAEAVLTAPPTAVVGISLAGVGLQDWVYIVTLAWLALQFAWFVYKRINEVTKDNTDE